MRHAVQTARRHPPRVVPEVQIRGEVAERFKAPVLKTGAAAMLPWVRIPPSPPKSSTYILQTLATVVETAPVGTLWDSQWQPSSGALAPAARSRGALAF